MTKVPAKEAEVQLREITATTLLPILNLGVAKEQEQLVATNAKSIAQAHFAPDAWFRAIYAGETPVGFVMTSEKPDTGEYFLWRFMIDARHQSKGYGKRALELLIARIRTLPHAKAFLLSHQEKPGSPGPFYEQLGFRHTGEMDEDERIMKLTFLP